MNKYIIEFLGTFFLVLIIATSQNPLAIGLGLSVLVYMGAHVSGAHYNPAVTLAMFINDQIDIKESGKYVASQLAGSVAAVYSLAKLGKDSFFVIPPVENQNINIQSFYFAEILFTFLLVFVILNVALNKRLEGNQFYGLAIGLTVTAGIFSVGDVSGAVFNPAVSFGSSLMGMIESQVTGNNISSSDFFGDYLISGIIGSVLASYLYKKVFK